MDGETLLTASLLADEGVFYAEVRAGGIFKGQGLRRGLRGTNPLSAAG